ncbi:right-handed parallel beta-helix repeat-containing protein, partial [Methanobrevibacter sp.]
MREKMEFKKSMIILILAIFLVSIAGVCAADANETVTASEDANQMDVSSSNVIDEDNLKTSEGNAAFTQANDDESDSQTLSADEGNYSNLRTDIENGGNLTKSYYRYHEGDGDTIEITNPMTINGNGAVIDMAGSNIRAFYVSASPVIIKNLTIKNANYTSGEGGAIYFGYGSSGTFEYCNFTNNTATGGGAAVYYYFEISGTFEYCNFANNTATTGGAVYMDSGTVENCNFTDNAASDGGGGAVYFGSTQISTVSNCNFVNNTATGGGGAVYFKGESRLSNSNFTDNKVTSDRARGGAVFLSRECIVTNCNFAGNIAPNHCGAIYMFSGTVENCNFTNNRANGDNGRAGAIYFSGISFVHTVSNCIFTDNHAVVGADIYADKDGVTADTCIFKNASQTTYQVTILPPTLNVDNFTTVYNSGEKLTFDLKTNEGTPVYNGNISISVYYKNNNSWFVNCSCLSGEGWNVDLPAGLYYAVFNTEYAEFKPINRTITIIPDTSFWALNHAINANDTSEVNLTNDYCYDPDFDGEFADGIVINRPVTINGNGHTINAQAKARVFNVAASGVTINNLTIKNANYTGNGGAIYFSQSGSVTNCNFTNNQATGSYPDGNGGAIYFGEDSEGSVTNCNFINNTATMDGGAVYIGASHSSVANCNFINNKAESDGGAIYMFSGSVENCNFTNNTSHYGGAIIMGSGSVKNCNFTNNTATNGGAIYHAASLDDEVINCNFINNKAEYEGGAIYFQGGCFELSVKNCNFTNNTADDDGGAIHFDENSELSVTNCNFAGNNATVGSAIYFCVSPYTLTISNSTFLNNRANADENTPLNVTINENNITITFMGQDNLLNAIYSVSDVSFTNVTYWGANGITNTGSSTITPSKSNREAGQNITVGIVVNDELVLNEVKVTDENGTIVLDISVGDNYYILVRHDEDSYYTEAEKAISNMKFHVNVTEKETTNKTVNITAKSNIYNEVVPGKLLFILPNNIEINATYASNGTWWAVHTFEDYAFYQLNASYIGLDNLTVSNATI